MPSPAAHCGSHTRTQPWKPTCSQLLLHSDHPRLPQAPHPTPLLLPTARRYRPHCPSTASAAAAAAAATMGSWRRVTEAVSKSLPSALRFISAWRCAESAGAHTTHPARYPARGGRASSWCPSPLRPSRCARRSPSWTSSSSRLPTSATRACSPRQRSSPRTCAHWRRTSWPCTSRSRVSRPHALQSQAASTRLPRTALPAAPDAQLDRVVGQAPGLLGARLPPGPPPLGCKSTDAPRSVLCRRHPSDDAPVCPADLNAWRPLTPSPTSPPAWPSIPAQPTSVTCTPSSTPPCPASTKPRARRAPCPWTPTAGSSARTCTSIPSRRRRRR